MTNTPQKSPPRYVPTLTQVVGNQAPASVSDDVATRGKLPSSNEGQAPQAMSASAVIMPATVSSIATQQLRQQLLVQTRQYMDLQLQKRTREIVSQLALKHAHKLFEELQPQIEATIQQVIDDAVKHAVAHAAAHSP